MFFQMGRGHDFYFSVGRGGGHRFFLLSPVTRGKKVRERAKRENSKKARKKRAFCQTFQL